MYNDNVPSAVPGRLYYYWLKGNGPTGAVCGSVDPGYVKISPPENVAATDGDYENKVVVSWSPPALGGDITGYELYRDPSNVGCGTLLAHNLSSGTSSYEDTAVTPGVRYYYSLRTDSPTGQSGCSLINDGYARVSKPTTVSATDGTYTDKVVVTWSGPGGGQPVSSYNLFRDTSPTPCAVLLASGISAAAASYADTAVAGGVAYYYSVQTVSPTGTSFCSNVDPGYAKIVLPICSNGLDDDGDGLIDLADPGCLGDPNRDTEKIPKVRPATTASMTTATERLIIAWTARGIRAAPRPDDPSEDDGTCR